MVATGFETLQPEHVAGSPSTQETSAESAASAQPSTPNRCRLTDQAITKNRRSLRIDTRYDKRARNYFSALYLGAAELFWL